VLLLYRNDFSFIWCFTCVLLFCMNLCGQWPNDSCGRRLLPLHFWTLTLYVVGVLINWTLKNHPLLSTFLFRNFYRIYFILQTKFQDSLKLKHLSITFPWLLMTIKFSRISINVWTLQVVIGQWLRKTASK